MKKRHARMPLIKQDLRHTLCSLVSDLRERLPRLVDVGGGDFGRTIVEKPVDEIRHRGELIIAISDPQGAMSLDGFAGQHGAYRNKPPTLESFVASAQAAAGEPAPLGIHGADHAVLGEPATRRCRCRSLGMS